MVFLAILSLVIPFFLHTIFSLFSYQKYAFFHFLSILFFCFFIVSYVFQLLLFPSILFFTVPVPSAFKLNICFQLPLPLFSFFLIPTSSFLSPSLLYQFSSYCCLLASCHLFFLHYLSFLFLIVLSPSSFHLYFTLSSSSVLFLFSFTLFTLFSPTAVLSLFPPLLI